MAPDWSVAEPPPGYGAVDDAMLCRVVRVSTTATLRALKLAVLKAYEDQYEPHQVTLFTRRYDDDAKAIKTDRQARL